MTKLTPEQAEIVSKLAQSVRMHMHRGLTMRQIEETLIIADGWPLSGPLWSRSGGLTPAVTGPANDECLRRQRQRLSVGLRCRHALFARLEYRSRGSVALT